MRCVVIGTSGSGKTSFARALAKARGVSHIELDSLHWAENWTERSTEDFIAGVEAASAGSDWVADGNYSAIRHVLWPRATDIVWLNYGRATVFSRILRRTLVRMVTQQELWAGNRESFRKTFLSRDSVLLWSFTTFGKNRVKYATLRSSGDFPHLRWHEFQHPRQAAEFVRAAETAST